ncbi:hypothetical protein FGK63_17260 [Ruegeria sediminis]|uniref:DUF3828 domain-containing protein n=1 Tax=Ruegeria sediminis TaxID=2583820 RepID=A0ABY2WU51_9RHOB|nr:hypothetical protein [Ruegeria sediminis]TMV04830.1 hypothetical protein FGK63_17260 [Ruegeria sediminis]
MTAFPVALFFAIVLSVLPSGRAAAQSPQEIVEWIYLSLAQPGSHGISYLSAPAQRDAFFSHRMSRFFAANDSHGGDLASACIDFGLEVPGQDYDAAEILRTIRLRTETQGARRIVHAEFQNFGQPAQVVYEFTAVDGRWLIDDIAGQGWRLSQIPCEPAGSGTGAAAQASEFCFKQQDGTLRIELGQFRPSYFELEIWASHGHFCAVGGALTPTATGWRYQEQLFDGRLCGVDL